MLKDGFISFEEFVDFVFSTGDKDFLSDAEFGESTTALYQGFQGGKAGERGAKQGELSAATLKHLRAARFL